MENCVLMLENTPVAEINIDDMEVYIYNRDLLPYSIRGKIKDADNTNPKEYFRTMGQNISVIKDFASSRVLSLSRENAKQIYAAFGISQDNSIENRVNICLKCKGVSVNDGYWFKPQNSDDTWEKANIRKNHLSEIVDVALVGHAPTLTADSMSPELTTKGLFRKAWIRENNDLYLIKSDRLKNFDNTKAELLTAKILDCTDIPHADYTQIEYDGLICAKTKNFVPERKSFVEAHEIIEYCRDAGLDYAQEMLHKFGKDFANIAIVDCIIQNTDRHDQNYGFIMDNKTGKLESVAPLFDHNQAIIADWLHKDVGDTLSQMIPGGYSIKEVAEQFSSCADIRWNEQKWKKLQKELSGQKEVFKKIDGRINEFACIHREKCKEREDIELDR